MPRFYISFATDAGFLGATVVRGENPEDALKNATAVGLNPGGEAAIVEVPPDAEYEPDMVAMIDRLVHCDEMLAMGAKRVVDCDPKIQARFNAEAEKVCQECNPVRK